MTFKAQVKRLMKSLGCGQTQTSNKEKVQNVIACCVENIHQHNVHGICSLHQVGMQHGFTILHGDHTLS
jgi:hypothetical protein